MTDRAEVFQRLRAVEDPELPVSIVDLGMVRSVDFDDPAHVLVTLVPTFLGCPAQLFIERDVERAVPGARVRWSSDVWRLEDVSPTARADLAALGVIVPRSDRPLTCPFCGSHDVEVTGEFGATLCRRLAFCGQCRSPLEVMRGPQTAGVVLSATRRAQ